MTTEKAIQTLSSLACIGLLTAGSGLGQSPEPEGEPPPQDEVVSEEITVTARQTEEALQDVPATVSVLTDGQIEAVGVQRAEDFIKVVPGVSMVNAAEVGDTQVSIRGINGSRDAENSFGFIVDGILLTNPAAFNREFSALRQIEVLKGPQGALYGRNAAAGAMIVTTRPPSDAFEADLKLSAAEDDSYFGSITLGGPLSGSEKAWFQLHGDFRTSDGYYFNSFQDRPVVDESEATSFGGRLILTPSPRTSWDLKARHGDVEAGAITFNAAFSLPSFASVLQVPEFFEDVNDHSFLFQGNIDPENVQESVELSAKLDRSFAWGELSAWALYSDIENSFFADGTSASFGFFNAEENCIRSSAALFAAGLTLPPPQFLAPDPSQSIFGPYSPTTCDGTQFQLRNQEDLSFQLRLSGDVDSRLAWQAGVYHLDIEREVGVNLGLDLGRGVVPALFVPQGGDNPTEQLVHDRFDTEVMALFGSLYYDPTPDVQLSLALRYDREERDVTNLVPTEARTQFVDFTLDGQFTGGAPLNPGLDPLLNPSGQIAPKAETFDEVQPKLSATWDAGRRLTLFGSWGVGFKSGGFNNQGSNATVELFFNDAIGTDLVIEDQFGEETSSAFEIGLKSQINRRFYVEAAFYQIDVDDMQFFEFLVGPFGLLRVVSNIDEVSIRGAEASFNWSVNNSLRLYAGFNLTDSEIDANASRPATVGNESPFTPSYTGHLAAELSRPMTDKLIFTASAYLSAVGETWFHTVQDETRVTLFNALFPGLGVADYTPTQRDAYEIVDLRIGVAANRWSVVVFAKNLTDEHYLEEVISAPEFGGSFIHPGSLRRVGVELGYRF